MWKRQSPALSGWCRQPGGFILVAGPVARHAHSKGSAPQPDDEHLMQQRIYPQQWQNQHIYPALDCPQVAADLALARASVDELGLFIEGLGAVRADAQALQDFLREVRLRAQRIRNIGWNLAVLAACQGSQDARDELAKQLASRARALNADLFKTLAPVEDLMLALPEAEFEQLMADSCWGGGVPAASRAPLAGSAPAGGGGAVGDRSWHRRPARLGQPLQRSGGQDPAGDRWPRGGTGRGEQPALQPAARPAPGGVRCHQRRLGGEQETVAAILNAINGWRRAFAPARRSRQLDALDLSCHQSHIERATLDTLMQETWRARGLGQRALGLMAERLGIEELGPEDLFAPPPRGEPRDPVRGGDRDHRRGVLSF